MFQYETNLTIGQLLAILSHLIILQEAEVYVLPPRGQLLIPTASGVRKYRTKTEALMVSLWQSSLITYAGEYKRTEPWIQGKQPAYFHQK